VRFPLRNPTSGLPLCLILSAILSVGTGCVRPEETRRPARPKHVIVETNQPETKTEIPKPPTREEIREEKATRKVLAELPTGNTSRSEIEKRIEDAEADIPDDEVETEYQARKKAIDAEAKSTSEPEDDQTAVPNQNPDPDAGVTPNPNSGGLLTENPTDDSHTDEAPPELPQKSTSEPSPPGVEAEQPKVKVEPAKPQPTVEPEKPKTKIEPAKPQPKAEPEKPTTKIDPARPQPMAEPEQPKTKVEPAKPQPTVEPVKPKTKVEPAKPQPKVEPKKPVAKVNSALQDILGQLSSDPDYQLSSQAATLGLMQNSEYLALQKSLTGTKEKSCNFFFAAALIRAHGPALNDTTATPDNFPIWSNLAANLDTKYFIPTGWKRISVATMKKWFKEGKPFDVALQMDAPAGKGHGHVAIPVGLNAKGEVLVAQARLDKVANQVVVYSDKTISSNYKIFARYPADLDSN
jgi:hypothetical protein